MNVSDLKNTIHLGDCGEIMKHIPDNSIDLVFTSPPYAERRKKTYGGIPEAAYLQWFKPIAQEIKRVLKPTGSFFLNIKPHTDKGERSLYVFELVIMLKRELCFLFVDELCWTKSAFPGKFSGRFKNAFEPVYHFAKANPSGITFNPVACGTPIAEESIKRTFRKQCGAPRNGSGMTGSNTVNIRHLELSRPSNHIHVNNVSNQHSMKQFHPATFPQGLAEFFIKSFTVEGDLVLDPFAGSGTVGIVCEKFNRNYILMDNMTDYYQLMLKQLSNVKTDFSYQSKCA